MSRRTGFATFAWLALALAACGSLELVRTAPDVARQRTDERLPALSVAQSGFGPAAAFVACQASHCPLPTRKTLATEPTELAGQAHPPAPPQPLPVPLVPQVTAPAPVPAVAAAEAAAPVEVAVTFAVGSASLSTAARTAIDEAVAVASPIRHVRVLGRTDSTGQAALNEVLARARADAVVQYLRSRYPHQLDKVDIASQGQCCYVAPNDTPAGRAANRRAEVTLQSEAGDL